jgi:hypothetical protein
MNKNKLNKIEIPSLKKSSQLGALFQRKKSEF